MLSLITVRPQELNRLPGAVSEPPAKPAFPAGGTQKPLEKPLEASRGRSWPRVLADPLTQPLLDASGVALGSPGVDFGELQAPKSTILEGVFCFLPRARVAEHLGCFRSCVSSHFPDFWSRAPKPKIRKSTHPPSENQLFQGTRRHRARHRAGHRRLQTAPKINSSRQRKLSKHNDFSGYWGRP